MLSQSTKYKLFLLLKAVSENETFVEEQRQTLGQQQEFEPYAAFKRINSCSENPSDNVICAKDIVRFLQQNQVDYIRETEFYQFFKLYDKDEDGNLDYDDFLQFVLPYDDVKLRAKITQRPTYVSETLPANVEFELSRLLEKEIHFHIKIEEEKKTLERQSDFNSMACFAVMDPKKFGYIDFDQLLGFLKKFDKDVDTKKVNAILRRLNSDEDFKIDFIEFTQNITPVIQGFNQDGCATKPTILNIPTDPLSDDVLKESKHLELLEHDGIAFNLEAKKQVLRNIELLKKTQIRGGKNDKAIQSVLRNFKQIYEQEPHNKVKNEFRDLSLRRKVKQDDQYMVNLMDVTPVKDKMYDENYENSIVVNKIGGGDAGDKSDTLDPNFGHMWQSTLWGGAVPMKTPDHVFVPYKTGRSNLSQMSSNSRASYQNRSKRVDPVTQANQLPPQEMEYYDEVMYTANKTPKQKGSLINQTRATGITGMNDTELPFSPAAANQNLGFSDPRTTMKTKTRNDEKYDSQHMGKSPSMQDVNYRQGRISQGSSNRPSLDDRRSELSNKYKSKNSSNRSLESRDGYTKMDKIKNRIMKQQMIDLKFMLSQVGQLEMEIEKQKQKLIGEGAEYNTIDAFRFIDQTGKGIVDHNEILQFLSAHFGQTIQFTNDDVALFVQRFDKNDRQSIKYSEFCTAFAPIDQNFQGELSGRRPQNTQLELAFEEVFSQSTRDLMEKIWSLHFEAEKLIEFMRQNMLKNPYFDISKAFKDLDQEEKGYISGNDIGKFLSLNSIDISMISQELIFMRFNKRQQADKINYAEFIEEMTPRATFIPN